VGSQLARWARDFDPNLSVADIYPGLPQCLDRLRLAGAAGPAHGADSIHPGLQPSLPLQRQLSRPSGVSTAEKLLFSERFRQRLRGLKLTARNPREAAVWAMVQMIEEQYPRPLYPAGLRLPAGHPSRPGAEHRATRRWRRPAITRSRLRAVAHQLRQGRKLRSRQCLPGCTAASRKKAASPSIGEFCCNWETICRTCARICSADRSRFSPAPPPWASLSTASSCSLLNFSRQVAEPHGPLPHGTPSLKDLLRMSWRSLILMAVADAQPFFSPGIPGRVGALLFFPLQLHSRAQ
jgi:hypothetical protein